MIRRITFGIAFAICNILVARTVVSLLDLDTKVLHLAQSVMTIPVEELHSVAWALSGAIGILAIVLWLVLDLDERLSSLLTPRPDLGSLPIAADPTFKIEVNRTTGKNTAELFVDLLNKSDRLVGTQFQLRATVNGKDLDRPIVSQGYVDPSKTTRLYVRIDDVPMQDDLLARMEYDVKYYYFGNYSRKARRTAKGIEWRSQKPQGEPGPRGGSVVKVITVGYYNQVEE